MEVLTFHFAHGVSRQVAVSDWYCKSAILHSLACKFGAMFITTDKYGCRQFLPRWSSSFPVHDVNFICYKQNLPWMVIEFNYFAHSDFQMDFLKRMEEYYEDSDVNKG